jgi:hypothetical protein
MRAGRQAALFVSAAIDDEFEVIFADAVKIQQCATFGGRAVGSDAFALFSQFVEQVEKGLLDLKDLVCKAFIVTE